MKNNIKEQFIEFILGTSIITLPILICTICGLVYNLLGL